MDEVRTEVRLAVGLDEAIAFVQRDVPCIPFVRQQADARESSSACLVFGEIEQPSAETLALVVRVHFTWVLDDAGVGIGVLPMSAA